jgi:hypothetical protein
MPRPEPATPGTTAEILKVQLSWQVRSKIHTMRMSTSYANSGSIKTYETLVVPRLP